MTYCPNCFKVHTYIDKTCSVCGTKLTKFPRKPFLSLAIRENIDKMIILLFIRLKWCIRVQNFFLKYHKEIKGKMDKLERKTLKEAKKTVPINTGSLRGSINASR